MLWWSALILAVLSFVVIGVGLVRERNKRCKSGEIKSIPINLVNDNESNIEDIRYYMRDEKGGE